MAAMRHQRKTALPEWSRKIETLRRRLSHSQGTLGNELNTSPMTVSRWERGAQELSADMYIQLGNLAGDPNAGIFGNAQACTVLISCVSFPRPDHGRTRPDFLPS